MKRTIKFDLFPQKADCKPIRMRVSYSGKRVDIRIGYSIEPSKWDAEIMRVIPNAKNKFKQSGNEINRAIMTAETQINEIFVRYELLEKRAPAPDELKNAFDEMNGKKAPETVKSFRDVYDEFTKTEGIEREWEKLTYVRFGTVKNHLKTFDENLSFENLTDEKLQQFLIHLHDVANLRNSTVAKNISLFKWFLRWAESKNYYKGKLHESFKPKLKGTDGNSKEVIHLTWDELMALLEFEFPKNKTSLSAVLDVFCFLCFTGLRYSDVYKLKRSDIKDNHIVVVTKKTNDGIKIELNKYSKAILNKYKNVHFKNDKALPVISNQKMNDCLKIMGKIAGINDSQRIVYFKKTERIENVYPKYALLTTHCGRRTFVVNALSLGIPPEVIMKWTGHSDYDSMKPYVKIVDELKEQEMGKFNKK
ncbi:MAG: site-specific integrase [Prevotellaceae bacterium]|nr:site-specific integrase [Prevotellaceae bacterium]